MAQWARGGTAGLGWPRCSLKMQFALTCLDQHTSLPLPRWPGQGWRPPLCVHPQACVCRLQVQINKQVVALPYKKYGLQVERSGINYVVDIPELGALISYNGLSFSIRLPYRLFGNNTKGQCGEPLSSCALALGRAAGRRPGRAPACWLWSLCCSAQGPQAIVPGLGPQPRPAGHQEARTGGQQGPTGRCGLGADTHGPSCQHRNMYEHYRG